MFRVFSWDIKTREANFGSKKELKLESSFQDPRQGCPKWWVIPVFRD